MSARQGYGALHSSIIFTKTAVQKRYLNPTKAQAELKALAALAEAGLPTPTILEKEAAGYTMTRMIGFVPLWKSAPDQNRIDRVVQCLESVHKTTACDRICPWADVEEEVFHKPIRRYNAHRAFFERSCSYVSTVNGQPIYPFMQLVHTFRERVRVEYDRHPPRQCLIHGDCQFNNVLYHSDTDRLVFIDPRGHFGATSLWGPAEYDTAKLLFALSGYDAFDSHPEPYPVRIEGSRAKILLTPLPAFVPANRMARLMSACVWLSNAHSFVHNSASKAIASHLIALAYASRILEEDDGGIIDSKDVRVDGSAPI